MTWYVGDRSSCRRTVPSPTDQGSAGRRRPRLPEPLGLLFPFFSSLPGVLVFVLSARIFDGEDVDVLRRPGFDHVSSLCSNLTFGHKSSIPYGFDPIFRGFNGRNLTFPWLFWRKRPDASFCICWNYLNWMKRDESCYRFKRWWPMVFVVLIAASVSLFSRDINSDLSFKSQKSTLQKEIPEPNEM